MEFQERLKKISDYVSELVCSYLPESAGFQKTVLEAADYSVRNGGKRLRPMMMLSVYQLLRGKTSDTDLTELTEQEKAEIGPFMAALEMIHSASLVHDDLPCMDNDTLRRGKPSTWAKFGEAMGTLAGDALLLYAFETAAVSEADPRRVQEAMGILAGKSGVFGMIGGQTVDVELSGNRPSPEQLLYMYRGKTCALIEAAFRIGAVIAGAESATAELLEKAAVDIGMAFQIRDDILDVISTEEELGKPIGSDAESEKVTWLTCYGMEASLKDVENYTQSALQTIKELGGHAFLEELIRMLAERRN